jgi:hypothetical protein
MKNFLTRIRDPDQWQEKVSRIRQKDADPTGSRSATLVLQSWIKYSVAGPHHFDAALDPKLCTKPTFFKQTS